MKILILGFGKTGKAIYNYFLANKNNEIYITDKNKIEVKHATYLTLDELYKCNLEFDLCFRSPGVPFNSELYQVCNLLSKEVINEIEYCYRLLVNKNIVYFAITGTNGKTTLVNVLAHFLNKIQDRKIYVVGNIGIPFISIINEIENNSIVIIELSSFQIENLKHFKTDYLLITNIYPNHLDVVTNYEFYKCSKLKIINHCKYLKNIFIEDQKLCNELNLEYIKPLNMIYSENKIINKHANFITSIFKQNGYQLKDDKLIFNDFHNDFYREDEQVILNTLFVNDSKSTNVESLKICLKNYEHYDNRLIIIGGIYKSLGIETIQFKDDDRIIVFGKSRVLLLNKIKVAKSYETLDDIFKYENLSKYSCIIFSPACSSFDQFENYIDRGKKFNEYVKEYGEKNAK
ncbi:MAG: Mur ligase family protein [Bacilli bacterium]